MFPILDTLGSVGLEMLPSQDTVSATVKALAAACLVTVSSASHSRQRSRAVLLASGFEHDHHEELGVLPRNGQGGIQMTYDRYDR